LLSSSFFHGINKKADAQMTGVSFPIKISKLTSDGTHQLAACFHHTLHVTHGEGQSIQVERKSTATTWRHQISDDCHDSACG
jgi:hypothetical protein